MAIRLVSLELDDVGRFDRRLVHFDGDLVGVVGPNGSGKSTILSAAHYALTGDLTRLGRGGEGIRADRVSSDVGGQPFVRLTLSPSGDPTDLAVLTRWLPDGAVKGRRKLIHSDRSYSSDADLATQVASWFGMPLSSIGDFVFVAQGRTADVIDDRPARRAEVLQRLFAVGVAERAREDIFLALRSSPAPPDARVAAETRARVAELEARVGDIDNRLSSSVPVPVEILNIAHSVVDQDRRRQPLVGVLMDAESTVARLEKVVAVELPTDPELPDYELVREWSFYHAAVTAATEARVELDKAETYLRYVAASKPLVPDEPVSPSSDDYRRLGLLEAVVDCGVGENCPVCGQTVRDAPAKSERAASEVMAIRTARVDYEKARGAYLDALSAKRGYDKALAEAQSRVDRWRGAVQSQPDPAKMKPSRPEPLPHQVKEQAAAHNRYREAVEAREASLLQLETARAAAQTTRARMPAPVEPEILFQARRLLESEMVASRDRDRLQGESMEARRSLTAAYQSLAAVETAERSSDRVAADRKVLEEAAAVLHRDAAPAAVVRARMAELTETVNSSLSAMRAGFSVSAGTEGDLTPYRAGKKVPRLSGGQACVLALAWRLAVSPGLVCLDEPTYGLDAERIDALRDALLAWRSGKSGGQIVIVTHDRRLYGVFDRLVELEP